MDPQPLNLLIQLALMDSKNDITDAADFNHFSVIIGFSSQILIYFYFCN